MSGKGSGRRPQLESEEVASANWDRIFPRKPAQGSATPEESGDYPRTDDDRQAADLQHA